MKKMTLTNKILLGLLLGFVFGLILNKIPGGYIKDTLLLGGVLHVVGDGGTISICFFGSRDIIYGGC